MGEHGAPERSPLRKSYSALLVPIDGLRQAVSDPLRHFRLFFKWYIIINGNTIYLISGVREIVGFRLRHPSPMGPLRIETSREER
jgi:hypothetical protein